MSTPTVLSIVFFIAGFLMALTYASNKRKMGTSRRRILVMMSIFMTSLSASFLLYSMYRGW